MIRNIITGLAMIAAPVALSQDVLSKPAKVIAHKREPGEPPVNTAAWYFYKAGTLTPLYVATLACQKEQIGTTAFDELKQAEISRFGPNAGAMVQEDYDEARTHFDKIPPSLRAEVARRSGCRDKSISLNEKIVGFFQDGDWAYDRENKQDAVTQVATKP